MGHLYTPCAAGPHSAAVAQRRPLCAIQNHGCGQGSRNCNRASCRWRLASVWHRENSDNIHWSSGCERGIQGNALSLKHNSFACFIGKNPVRTNQCMDFAYPHVDEIAEHCFKTQRFHYSSEALSVVPFSSLAACSISSSTKDSSCSILRCSGSKAENRTSPI